jgi:hypothetical protein
VDLSELEGEEVTVSIDDGRVTGIERAPGYDSDAGQGQQRDSQF